MEHSGGNGPEPYIEPLICLFHKYCAMLGPGLVLGTRNAKVVSGGTPQGAHG